MKNPARGGVLLTSGGVFISGAIAPHGPKSNLPYGKIFRNTLNALSIPHFDQPASGKQHGPHPSLGRAQLRRHLPRRELVQVIAGEHAVVDGLREPNARDDFVNDHYPVRGVSSVSFCDPWLHSPTRGALSILTHPTTPFLQELMSQSLGLKPLPLTTRPN